MATSPPRPTQPALIKVGHIHTLDTKKLESEFHQRLKPLVNKSTQGYVMGAFRDALTVTTGTVHTNAR